LLARDLVLQHNTETIASVIVHEATHARIDRRGIRAWPDLIGRIERCCLSEQIAFLEKVPGAEDAVRYYRGLEDDQWWTPERKRQRLVEYYGQLIEQLDPPRWIVKAYAFFTRWRPPRR
jgi:hypothetical protein